MHHAADRATRICSWARTCHGSGGIAGFSVRWMRNYAIPVCVAVGVAAVSVAVRLLFGGHPLLEEDAEDKHPLLRYEEINS